MRQKKFDCRGAFLLEALLAVFIVSVALVALIRGMLTSLNAAVEAEHYAEAIGVADNVFLEVLRLNGQSVTAPVVFDEQSQDVSAKVEIKPSDNLLISHVLQQVRLTVTWPGSVKDKTMEATTLIFGPVDEKK